MAPSQIAPAPDGALSAPLRLDPARLLRRGLPPRLAEIAFDELPADVRDTEVTVTALFRASLALNLLLGGTSDMTFSARCHLESRRRRSPVARALWSTLARGIDLACAVLRGECEHCATAWDNHLGRGEP
ncbi:MAG: hypothetical protein ACFBWO_06180 [Paracoccaceae bacterium]